VTTRSPFRSLLTAGLLLATPFAGASLIADVLACTDGRELRTEAPCGQIAEEALDSLRMVESLADAMVERKQHRKATVLLEAALRRFPGNASLTNRLSVARSYAEESEAIAARDRARNASPQAEEIAASMTRIRCTRLSGDAGLAACDAALAREPGDPMLLSARGDLLAADGRIEEAIGVFGTVLRARPDDVIARQKIALLSGRKDRPTPSAAPVRPSGPPVQAAKPAAPAASAARPVQQAQAVQVELEQQLAMLQKLRSNALMNEAEFEARRRALLDAYLSPLPAASTAQAGSAASGASDKLPAVDFGKFHALVIGINAYRYLPTLDTAQNDAKAVAEILKDRYDFNVKLLMDPTREQIIEALDDLRDTLVEKDNLLIYYAGHGWLDKEADQGFWLPADARAERRSRWISNDVVRDLAKALKAKHMLVIADSCFSGTLTRGISARPRLDPDYLKRISSKRARQAMSSGGLEPVFDSVDGKHSPFARALVKILTENRGVIDATTLFSELRRPVSLSADQTPEFSDIRRAGHDGGDFMFVRRR
jgi:tetratricopeptide (TPR) repeat protein